MPESLNAEARTCEYVLATETPVRGFSWATGYFDEILLCEPENVDVRRLESGRVSFLTMHNRRDLEAKIGTICEYRFERKQLLVTVRFDQTDEAEANWARVQRGELPCCSIGFDVKEYEVTEREGQVDIRRAILWEPLEGSLVTIPADLEAASRSHNKPDSETRVEVRLRRAEQAMPPKDTDNNVPKTEGADTGNRGADGVQTQGGTPEEGSEGTRAVGAVPAAPAPAPEPAAAAPAQAPEGARTASFEYVAQRAAVIDLGGKEILEIHKRGLTEEQASDAILEIANKRSGPEISGHIQVGLEERTKIRSCTENAILNSIDSETFKLEDGAREFRGRTLLELGERHLARDGVNMDGMTPNQRAGVILGERSVGGVMTPSDFPLILGNVVGATLLDGYERAERTHGTIARVVSLGDFKEHTRLRMGDAPKLEQVTDLGEYAAGSFDEEGTKYKLKKFGKIVGISRETILNDDLDMLGRIPGAMGEEARELENLTVYEILMSNPIMDYDGFALFSAEHANVVTGDLDDAGLQLAVQAMKSQKTKGGNRIRMRPKSLVCATEQEFAAMKMLKAIITPSNTGDVNVHHGSMEVVSEATLGDQANPLNFYIASDPRRVDMIELAFLRGHEKPYVEYKQGFEVDGLRMKIRHELVAAAIDHRGLVKVVQ